MQAGYVVPMIGLSVCTSLNYVNFLVTSCDRYDCVWLLTGETWKIDAYTLTNSPHNKSAFDTDAARHYSYSRGTRSSGRRMR